MRLRLLTWGIFFSLILNAAAQAGPRSPTHSPTHSSTPPRPSPSPTPLPASPPPEAQPVHEAHRANPHWVGLLNTFVPGGGQFLLGDYGKALTQFGIESATFGFGFSLSRLSPMTLDGVPEDLPVRSSNNFQVTNSSSPCILFNSTHTKCLLSRTVHRSGNSSLSDENEHDFAEPVLASMLQEFAIKYHMVNVFESYREAGMVDGKVVDPWVDPRPIGEMFKDPFRVDTLLSPWVWVPLTLILAGTIIDYNQQVDAGITPLSKMNWYSNVLFGLNYMALQPVGSGAPEEMFYRGYLQNEFYHLIESPFFSIPMSTLAFSFSHAPPGRIGAAVAGAYLGTLAHINHGSLSKGIALHFWSVVILGIETAALTFHAQSDIPVGGQIQFQF